MVSNTFARLSQRFSINSKISSKKEVRNAAQLLPSPSIKMILQKPIDDRTHSSGSSPVDKHGSHGAKPRIRRNSEGPAPRHQLPMSPMGKGSKSDQISWRTLSTPAKVRPRSPDQRMQLVISKIEWLRHENEKLRRDVERSVSGLQKAKNKNETLRQELRSLLLDEIVEYTELYPAVPRLKSPSTYPAPSIISIISSPEVNSASFDMSTHVFVPPSDEGESVAPSRCKVTLNGCLAKTRASEVLKGMRVSDKDEGADSYPSPVVVKMISKQNMVSVSRLKSLENEIRVLEHLTKQSTAVDYYGCWSTDSHVCLLMEHFGKDLFELSTPYETGLPELGLLQIAAGITQGLDVLHSDGISHCDIKPENILVDGEGTEDKPFRVKLSDFGVSIFDAEIPDGKTDRMCGSPGFFPPQVVREGGFSPKCGDVWSMGALLLEGLIGRNSFNQLWMVAYHDLSFSKHSPEAFQQVLCKFECAIENALKACVGKNAVLIQLILGVLKTEEKERSTSAYLVKLLSADTRPLVGSAGSE